MKRKHLFRAAAAFVLAAMLTVSAFAAESGYSVQPIKGTDPVKYTVMIPKTVRVLLAAYSRNGQFQSVKVIHEPENGGGEVRINFELPKADGQSADKLKLFFLNADWTPIKAREKSEWSTTPFDPYETPSDPL